MKCMNPWNHKRSLSCWHLFKQFLKHHLCFSALVVSRERQSVGETDCVTDETCYFRRCQKSPNRESSRFGLGVCEVSHNCCRSATQTRSCATVEISTGISTGWYNISYLLRWVIVVFSCGNSVLTLTLPSVYWYLVLIDWFEVILMKDVICNTLWMQKSILTILLALLLVQMMTNSFKCSQGEGSRGLRTDGVHLINWPSSLSSFNAKSQFSRVLFLFHRQSGYCLGGVSL